MLFSCTRSLHDVVFQDVVYIILSHFFSDGEILFKIFSVEHEKVRFYISLMLL